MTEALRRVMTIVRADSRGAGRALAAVLLVRRMRIATPITVRRVEIRWYRGLTPAFS